MTSFALHRSSKILLPLFIAAVLACGGAAGGAEPAPGKTPLFPKVEPFETGTLKVDDIHEIFYELCGNKEGKPVIVLHGGPGVGAYPRLRRYFDPEKFLIVLHDQRGSNRSTPKGELRKNTTGDLVEDIEQLRKHLGFESFLLFGGSWGSTLSLAYAETHPERVNAMVLRGIFLGTQEEIDFHYWGARRFFPEEHAELLAVLPDPDRRPLPPYLYKIILHGEDAVAERVIDALWRFEMKMSKLHNPDKDIDRFIRSVPLEAKRIYAGIDLHYVANGYFLEEGQLMADLGKIAHIPMVIVHGRYDVNCSPRSAYRLHEALPKSRLVIVEKAGHVESDPGMAEALVEAVKTFE